MIKKIVDKKSLDFLKDYLNTAAPTSHEAKGQKKWMDYIKPFVDEMHVDVYGTAYGVINPGQPYKVVIEAHADEISWMVSRITDEGMLSVLRNGGMDQTVAPAKRVTIHGKNGPVTGVFGWPAIHLRGGAEGPKPQVHTLFVDVGCKNKEEVLALGINVGTVLTYRDEMEILNDRFICGRALDNRIGGFMIAQVARLIKEKKVKLPYSLYVVNAVMEEVGLRGAEMIVNTIKPNVAIITDVAHDTTTPLIDTAKHGEHKCGSGPMVAYGPSVHNKFLELIIDTAEKKKIPFQREANSRRTGTDTDAFAFANGGVVSALISIPERYMHTPSEMVHLDDVCHTTELMFETLKNIEADHDFHYLR